jgi:hypothetical protein
MKFVYGVAALFVFAAGAAGRPVIAARSMADPP